MDSPWFLRLRPRPEARMRLFCLPWAGVGASVYRSWPDLFAPEVDVWAVQPPGRESRLREQPLGDMDELVTRVYEAIAPELDRPFAFFGHSMGATVAYEVSRRLLGGGGPLPDRLFVSGRRAPRLPDPDPPLRHLTDDEFLRRIRTRYGGIPEEVMRHRDLVELLLPALRFDIAALETHRYVPGPPLPCAITAFGGTSDPRARASELAAWQTETSGPFDLRFFPGNHFFLEGARQDVVTEISARIDHLLSHADAGCA